jgi:hypothetical protein
MQELDVVPDTARYLELWVDIAEVGEPFVTFWPLGEDERLDGWLASLPERDIEVLAVSRPFPGIDEWVVRTTDESVGVASYWIKLRSA